MSDFAPVGQLGVGLAGLGIGAVFGAPGIGFAVGKVAGGLIFGGGPGTVVEGPRLNDLKVLSAAPGRPRPIVFGTMRFGGNVIWTGGITETRIEEEQGGKGGGGSTTVSYKYTVDLAIALTEGPVEGVLKVFADGKLLADFTSSTGAIYRFPEFNIGTAGLRVYLGTATQEPDPLIQADIGINDTPAFRSTCYIVLENLPIEDYGNRIPQITAFVTTNATNNFPLTTITPIIHGAIFYSIWSPNRLYLTFHRVNLTPSPQQNEFIRIYAPTQTILAESGGTSNAVSHLAGQPTVPGVDLEGNIFTLENGFATTGMVAKWDGETFVQLGKTKITKVSGFSQGELSFDPIRLVVIGNVVGGQKVLVTGNLDEVAIVDANVTGDKLLAELAEYSLDTLFPGSPGAPFNIKDVTVDSDGNGWILARDSLNLTNTFLFKVSPGLGDVTDIFTIDKVNSRLISYDEDNNSLIILQIASPSTSSSMYRWSIDDESVVASSGTISLNTGDSSRYESSMRGGAYSKSLYIHKDTDEFYEINTDDLSITRTLSDGDWAPGSGTQVALYDRSTDSVIRHDSSASNNIYWFRLDRKDGGGVTLKSIVDDIATRLGLVASDLDTSDLSSITVHGYTIHQRMTARRAMEPLVAAYFFDGIDSDFKLKFPTRGNATVDALTEDDIGARTDVNSSEPFLNESRREEVELLERIDVTAALSTIDYQAHAEYAKRTQEAVNTKRKGTLELPIAFSTTAEIAQIAEKHLYLDWISRTEFSFFTTRKHILIDPADSVTVNSDNTTHTIFLNETVLGAQSVIENKGVSEDIAVYTSDAEGHDPLNVPTQSIPFTGPSTFQVMDTPLLRDSDDGEILYMAAGAYGTASFPGVVVDRSTDGSAFTDPAAIISSSRNSIIGYAVTKLADAPGGRWTTWDRDNTVDIRLFRGSLSSVTELQVLNFSNAILIGDEIVQFSTAILNSDGTYTLSTLLRGRRGSEKFRDTHAIGDRIVLLQNTTVLRVPTPLADLSLARFYRAVTIGGLLSQGIIKSLTWAARSLKPYAPADITLSQSAGSPSDLTIQFRWRTRLDGEWRDFVDAGFGEASEDYDVDILDAPSGGVKRTIGITASSGGSQVNVGTPVTASYSEADQLTDFGGLQAKLFVTIYQKSVKIGRGFGSSATIEL